MKKPKLTAEIFTFPHRGKYVIYAPLRQVMLLANAVVVNILSAIKDGTFKSNGNEEENKVVQLLRDKGIVDGAEEKPPSESNVQEFQPAAVTLFPSNQCNMRCIYCYASAGDCPSMNMSWNVAKSAIDYVAQNAQKLNQEQFSVGFHGGGEPTLRWSFFKRCVEYAKELADKLKLKATFSAATNGAFKPNQIKWIIKNLHSLSISLDGTADIQNLQRPLANGKGSYDIVAESIKALDEAKFSYGLRSTVTNHNVFRLKEIVASFLDDFHPERIHFEPLFSCGRCLTNKVEAPAPATFIQEFLKAHAYAEKRNATLAYSGLRIGGITNTFCGACGNNFCVTPEGDVTSCFEVMERDDFRSDLFFFGKWQPEEKRFDIWPEKLDYQKSFKVQNISYCSDCLAKWHCAGDCLAKVSYDFDLEGDRGSDRCWMNQEITKRRILQILKNPQKVVPLNSTSKNVNKEIKNSQAIEEDLSCNKEANQIIG